MNHMTMKGTPGPLWLRFPTRDELLEKFNKVAGKLSNEKAVSRMLHTELAKLVAVDLYSALMTAYYLVVKADVTWSSRNCKKIIEALDETMKYNNCSIAALVFCVVILGDLWQKSHDAMVGKKFDYMIMVGLSTSTAPIDPRDDPMGALEYCPGYVHTRASWLLPESKEGRIRVCKQMLRDEQARSGRPPQATGGAGRPLPSWLDDVTSLPAAAHQTRADSVDSSASTPSQGQGEAPGNAKGRGTSAGSAPGRPGGATRASDTAPAPPMRRDAEEERRARMRELPPEECAPLLNV
eukprot:jgi/Mesvir1/18750/Mv01256-RA.1